MDLQHEREEWRQLENSKNILLQELENMRAAKMQAEAERLQIEGTTF